MGKTPFSLAYGAQTIIPVEVGAASFQTSQAHEVQNLRELELNLDIVDELLDRVALRMAVYQQRVARHYNKSVQLRSF